MKSVILGLLISVVASAGAFADSAASHTVGRASERLEIIDRTIETLENNERDRRELLQQRTHALYRAMYADFRRLWIDGEARQARVRLRGLAKRVMQRDSIELELVREELREAHSARQRVVAERSRAKQTQSPKNLVAPVSGSIKARFGRYRHHKSRARLTRRGVEFAARAFEEVRAPASGTIAYAGPLRGLGSAVVLTHDDGAVSVLGGVASSARKAVTLDAGQVLGHATGTRVYFELRLPMAAGGEAVDPVPFLQP